MSIVLISITVESGKYSVASGRFLSSDARTGRKRAYPSVSVANRYTPSDAATNMAPNAIANPRRRVIWASLVRQAPHQSLVGRWLGARAVLVRSLAGGS